jgi:hypothetical protein
MFTKMAVEGAGRMQVMKDLHTVNSLHTSDLRIDASRAGHAKNRSYKIDPDALPETCKQR